MGISKDAANQRLFSAFNNVIDPMLRQMAPDFVLSKVMLDKSTDYTDFTDVVTIKFVLKRDHEKKLRKDWSEEI